MPKAKIKFLLHTEHRPEQSKATTHMKLLNIVHRYWPYRGGSEQYFAEMSERLVRDGHEVSIFTTNAWATEYFITKKIDYTSRNIISTPQEIHNGVTIRRFPVRHFPFAHGRIMHWLSRVPLSKMEAAFSFPSPLIPSLWTELFFHRGKKYDIVHTSPFPFNSLMLAACLFTRKNNIPLVITPFFHIGEPDNPRILQRYNHPYQIWLLKMADAIIVQTGTETDFLQSVGIPKEKITVMGMGVNPDEIIPGSRDRFLEKFNIAKAKKIVLHIGALCEDKGTLHVVEALKQLWQENDQIFLILAGDKLDSFHRYFGHQPEKIRNNILILDFVQGQDKRDMFHAADVVVLPSRIESYGIVYLEAWLARKPVVGSDAGGVPYVINNMENGIIVPFGDVEQISNSIEMLLSNDSLASRMGEAGFYKVMSSATWDKRYPIFKNALLNQLK